MYKQQQNNCTLQITNSTPKIASQITGNVTPFYNIMQLKVGDYVANAKRTEHTSALVHLFREALIHPTAVKYSTDQHNRKIKEFLDDLTQVRLSEFKQSVQMAISKINENNGKMLIDENLDGALDWWI